MSTREVSPLTRWQVAVRESTLPANSRLVALTMATYMNPDGTAGFPGAYRLRDGTGLSLRAVYKALGELVSHSYLVVVERGGAAAGGKRRATEYRAVIPTRDQCTTCTGQDVHQCTTSTGPTSAPRAPMHQVQSTSAPGAYHLVSTMPSSSRDARPSFDDDFARVWANYPKKLNRKGALKAYGARRRAGVSADELLTATTSYAAERAGQDSRYTMHGSTFFGPNERWRDSAAAATHEQRTPTSGARLTMPEEVETAW